MSVTDDVLAVCELRRAPWPTPDRCCVWCGNDLPKRSRRWCSQECSDEFTRQHNWTWARAAAIRRDGGACVRCGHDGHVPAERFWHLLLVLRGGEIDHPARYRAFRLISRERPRWQLEVNHRTPVLGRHGTFGCHHHLDGLETLCHPCHLRETAEQFGHHAERRNPHPTLFDHEGAA